MNDMGSSMLGEPTQQNWNQALKHVIDLSSATVKRNADLESQLAELQMEIADLKRTHNVHLSALRHFESQDPLILCVIELSDIFSPHLLAEGYNGGQLAAQQFTKAIAEYLSTADVRIFGRLSFWVTLYYSRAELLDTLHSVCSPSQLDGFLAGFSHTSPRFCVVEAYGKDSVQMKIKEYLQTYTWLPQTLRVFVAGSHGGAFSALGSELLGLGKLVLLESLGDVHGSGMGRLNVNGSFVSGDSSGSASDPTAASTSGGGSTAMSPVTQPVPHTPQLIDPSLPLHKQNPPPCNEYYLMPACSKGEACKYSHRYSLTKQDIASLRSNAKKAPCNWLKNGLPCPNKSDCCWGHICPNGSNCYHYTTKKCWFKAEGMHPPLTINQRQLPPLT